MKYFTDQAPEGELNQVVRGSEPHRDAPLIRVNGLNFIRPNYSKLPTEDLQYSLRSYIEDKIPTGHFLTAVLSNDLRGAVANADGTNIKLIVDIVRWLYWEVPAQCWGSKEKFKGWITGKVIE